MRHKSAAICTNPYEAILHQRHYHHVKPSDIITVDDNVVHCVHKGEPYAKVIKLTPVVYQGSYIGDVARCPVCYKVYYKPNFIALNMMKSESPNKLFKED